MELDFYPTSLIVDQGNNKIIVGGVNSDLETYDLYEIDMCPFMDDKKDGSGGELELVPNNLQLEAIRQFCISDEQHEFIACFN